MKVPLTRLIHGNPVVWVPLTRSIRGNPVICVPLVFAMVTSLLGPLGLAAQEKLEETTLGFPSGRQVQAELAVSEEQRARGLMFRDSLGLRPGHALRISPVGLPRLLDEELPVPHRYPLAIPRKEDRTHRESGASL